MQQMSGYFGGYISKKQKMKKYELNKSISAPPLLKETFESKNVKRARAQMAHVCNRLFTALESKGIVRSAPEEFMLAPRYKPHNELSSEFIRTYRHRYFHGASFLRRFDTLKQRQQVEETHVCVPKINRTAQPADEVSIYGFRGKDPRVFMLSPWDLCQWIKPHHVQPQSEHYLWTIWTATWDPKSGRTPLAGQDYVLNEQIIANETHLMVLPQRASIGSMKT